MSRHKKSPAEKPVVDDVCRLCLTEDDLVWIFDERIAEPNNMKDVIFLTTGVEIKNTDMVSQKVCKKCCQITIKIFKFRTTAIKNDRELKNKLSQITNNVEDDETRQDCSTSDKGNQEKVCRVVPTPSTTPKGTKNLNKATGVASNAKNSQVKRRDTSPLTTKKRRKSIIEESSSSSVKNSPLKKQDMVHSQAHESVIKLSDEYTGLKIPRSCIMYNLSPSVVLDSQEVKEWFRVKLEKDLKRRKEAKKREFELEELSVFKKSSRCNRNLIESDEDDSDAVIVVDEPPSETSRRTKTSFASITCKRRLISVESPPPKRRASADAASISSHEQDADEVCSNSSVSEKGSLGGDLLLSSINKSTNVHLCQICNAVTYNNKEMKNHVRKHTMCPFCKVRFRTLETKVTHVEKECPIRSIMQNLPKIPLVKIDQMKDVIDKYPNAFAADQDSSCGSVSESDTIIVEGTTPVETEQNKPVAEIDITLDEDVMYISDDDDDDSVIVSVPKSPEEISECRSETTRAEEIAMRPKIPKFDMPDDEILRNVDWKGREENVLKSLIRLVDKYQTFSRPTNADNITVQGQNDKIYALKNIVPYLRRYKIPIELEYNPKLTVQYEDITPPRVKVKDLWDPQGASIQRSILPKSLVTELNKTPRGLQKKPSTKQKSVAAQNKLQPAAAQNKMQPAAAQNKQLATTSISNSNARLSLKANQTIAVSTTSKQDGSLNKASPQQISVQAPSSSIKLSSKPNQIIASATVAASLDQISSSVDTFPQQSVVQETSSPNTIFSSSPSQTVTSVIVPAPSNHIASSVNAYPQQVSVPETPIARISNMVSVQAAPVTQMNVLPTPNINMPLMQMPTISQVSSMAPIQAPMSSILATPVLRTSTSLGQVSQNSVIHGQTVLNSIVNQILDVPRSSAGDNYITGVNTNTARAPYQYDYVSSGSSALFTNDVPSMARPVILDNENVNKQTIRVKTISELNRKE